MERFGFVGLPNAGKSSLYNALAGGGALAAPYAFATTDPNVGVARVPDPRLDALAAMSKSKNVVPATVQFVDIGGLVAGASKGEGLGNKFLSHIREVDAIVFVLRAFADDDVPGSPDPLEHLGILELELTYADLETVENQIEKRRKAAKGDRSLVDEVAALEKAKSLLEAGTPLYRAGLKDEERRLLKGYFLLTNRPVLALVNVAEDQLDDIDAVIAPVQAELDGHAEVIGMCVQLEAEAAMLDADERVEMLEGLGLGEGALSEASSGPRSSTGTSCSSSARGPRPATSASSASRARTTSSRTATCWRSASTSEFRPRPPAAACGELIGAACGRAVVRLRGGGAALRRSCGGDPHTPCGCAGPHAPRLLSSACCSVFRRQRSSRP